MARVSRETTQHLCGHLVSHHGLVVLVVSGLTADNLQLAGRFGNHLDNRN